MGIKTENLYSTSDLSCATAINLFYPLWAVDRTDPKKAEFVFKREDGLDKLIESFWSNTLRVSPLTYFQQLKILKSRLYQEK